MTIRWSHEARSDVDRLADFVAAHDAEKAKEIEVELGEAPKKLLQFSRLGSRLTDYDPLEVRELRVRRYLLRYQLLGDDIRVLRVFHGREDRR